MKPIYYRINGLSIDLNGEIIENLKAKTGLTFWVEKAVRGYYVYRSDRNDFDYYANTTSEIYAYFAGILKY